MACGCARCGRGSDGFHRRHGRRFSSGSRLRRRSGRRLDPNSHGSALGLDLERICLSHEVAQLAGPVGPQIEIGGQVGKPLSDFPESDPPVFAFHLGDDLLDDGGGCIRGLEQLRPRGGILIVRRAAKQVLGIENRRQACLKLSGVFCSPNPNTSTPCSRMRAASRVKSLSDDTRQNPSKRPP